MYVPSSTWLLEKGGTCAVGVKWWWAIFPKESIGKWGEYFIHIYYCRLQISYTATSSDSSDFLSIKRRDHWLTHTLPHTSPPHPLQVSSNNRCTSHVNSRCVYQIQIQIKILLGRTLKSIFIFFLFSSLFFSSFSSSSSILDYSLSGMFPLIWHTFGGLSKTLLISFSLSFFFFFFFHFHFK